MLKVISLLVFVIPATSLNAQVALVPANFRANTQLVLVPVTVTDHNGKTILGLDAGHFTVSEDQKQQSIVSFSSDDSPCSVGVILDISGSMRQTLGGMKDVAKAFLNTANPQDEFFLLTVSTEPDAVSGFTTDTQAIQRQIDSAPAGGFTALIDTVYLGLRSMRSAKQPRRAMLVLSDGMDNHSRYSKSELMRVALEADVQVYAVIVDNPSTEATIPFRPAMIKKAGDQAQEAQGRSLLEDLSDKTGGIHFRAGKADEAKQATAKIGAAIRNEYVIGYQAPAADPTGKWHRIRVKSDVPRASIYARNGYYAR